MIKRVCTHCNQDIGDRKDANSTTLISHGICVSCFRKMYSQYISSIEDFLDAIDYPVVVVDPEATVLYANTGARQMIGKKINEIEGLSNGEVLGCSHSKEPGGCGESVHCMSCVVRSAITKTVETGKPQQQIPAVMDLASISGDRTVRFYVSTDIVDGLVFLRIDEISDAAMAEPIAMC